MTKLFIGLMSGTSLDGIDAVITEISSSGCKLIASHYQTFDEPLLSQLKLACRESTIDLNKLGSLDAELGTLYAETIKKLLAKANISAEQIAAIGSHGQTIQHSPTLQHPFTLQIGDPNQLAEKTGIRVVADFRRRDIAAGGQGAPLAPAFHNAVFRSSDENRIILNLGGIANVTVLLAQKEAPIVGFDCGPANTLMDQWCQQHFDQNFDRDGAIARTGSINKSLLDAFMRDEFFQKKHPKSTGPEYFSMQWLSAHLEDLTIEKTDVLATLCELTAYNIKVSLVTLPSCDRLIVCGGGSHNDFLIERLSHNLECLVETSTSHGVDPDWVEAMAFSWLAKQTLDGKFGNIPSVTGATKEVVLGAIYSA
ncbi:MAG: anhydro-N-acetylmuramic acid kinase [Cycloclasticus sp. symbiont of Poecilosclerida sp. M]|nr:MAG: anhydro-N-acetylmuramic acid kinase [Cycloclasticus sp. symbiont of Poecilosclerida sp. M]